MIESSPAAEGHTHTGLKAVLGLRDLVFFYLVAVFSIRLVPLATSIGPSVILLWLVAMATYFVPLGLTTIDLSSRYPDEGGIYVWSKTAFGDFHGFMTAWTYWTSNVVFFPAVLVFLSTQMAYVVPSQAHLADEPWFVVGVSVGMMLFILWLNIRGLESATVLNNVAGVFRFLTVGALVGLGVATWVRFGPATDFSASNWAPRVEGVRDLVFLSTLAYSFAGLESASLLGDEVREPRRTIPRAILTGGGLIAVLYVLSSLALLAALDPAELTGLAGFADAVAASAARVGGAGFGGLATSVVSILLVVMAMGIVSVWLAAAARLPFVVGLDRFLPPAFGRIHPKYGSPHIALITLAAASIGLILLSAFGGAAEQIYQILVSVEIVIFLIPNLYLFGALIWLRKRPSGPDAMRVPGGSHGALVAGGMGLLVTLGSIVLALLPSADIENLGRFYLMVLGSLGGNLATGIGLYYFGRRKRARSEGSRADA